jgi:hypothetical protein
LALEVLECRKLLSATAWTVNSLGDAGTGLGNSGDLRYCITQSDMTTGDNTINFAVTGTITLNSALPVLTNTTGLMDFEGPGANNLSVSGNNNFGVFQVDSGVTAKLVGLTITKGSVEGATTGAGINNAGTLNLVNSDVSSNGANQPASTNIGGGGIYNNGTMTISNSNIDNNSSLFIGGGISNDGILTISNSFVDNNKVTQTSGYICNGGGISSTGTLTITGSTIDNNWVSSAYSCSGGGISSTGALTITNSTIDHNTSAGDQTATSNGGARSYGGGISSTGTLNLTECTVSGNVASGGPGNNSGSGGDAFGGAVYSTGELTLDDCTVSSNSALGGAGYAVSGFLQPTSPAGNASGGGVYIGNGTVQIDESSIDE